jgi:hypothetical protein
LRGRVSSGAGEYHLAGEAIIWRRRVSSEGVVIIWRGRIPVSSGLEAYHPDRSSSKMMFLLLLKNLIHRFLGGERKTYVLVLNLFHN